MIVSGSRDGTLKVWDASSGQETLTLKGHIGAVESVAFSPNGKKIFSFSADSTLKVWDASLSMDPQPREAPLNPGREKANAKGD
jgi:WD40 repeat protein